jgi:hypothetical protein
MHALRCGRLLYVSGSPHVTGLRETPAGEGLSTLQDSVEKNSHTMWTQRVQAACVVVFVLSGWNAKQQDSQAEPKTQRVGIPQAQTKPSPPQEASLAEAIPSNASETQARALRRYNENAWFIQEAMRVAQRDETLNAGISTLVKAGRPDWDQSYLWSTAPPRLGLADNNVTSTRLA